MKTKVVIIALFVFAFVRSVYAQEMNYEISSDKKTITVSGDCIINVEDFAPDNVVIYGNLDKGGIKSSNGVKSDLFEKKTEDLNKDSSHKGVVFQKETLNNTGHAQICITYTNLEDCTLKFYCAKSQILTKANGENYTDWSPDTDNTFAIDLCKRTNETTENINGLVDVQQAADEGDKTPGVKEHAPTPIPPQSPYNKEPVPPIDDPVPHFYKTVSFVLGILTIVFGLIIYFLLKSLKKKTENLKKLVKENEKLNVSIKKMDHSEEDKTHLIDKELKVFITNLFASTDKTINKKMGDVNTVLQGIKDQIESLGSQLSNQIQSNNNPSKSISNGKEQATNSISTDTEVVHYIPESNSFIIGEVNDHIFRIYLKNGIYYYTIVDDDNIRKEIIGALPAFEKCISIQASQSGSKVVPVSDGKLIQNGSNFLVDTNNKLLIRFE